MHDLVSRGRGHPRALGARSDSSAIKNMKNEVREKFIARFGREPSCIGCAPGRLEILGNHTDYNQGTVLSVALNAGTSTPRLRKASTMPFT